MVDTIVFYENIHAAILDEETISFLSKEGFRVMHIAKIQQGMDDSEIVKMLDFWNGVLISCDKDFLWETRHLHAKHPGGFVFRERQRNCGNVQQ